jgi:hypothetical protein
MYTYRKEYPPVGARSLAKKKKIDLEMNSLPTPTTAFLNSCFDFEASDTPKFHYGYDRNNVFDQAFEVSNIASAHQLKTSTEYEGNEGIMTPEGNNGLGLRLQNSEYVTAPSTQKCIY